MPSGPIELIEVAFPENRFKGAILPELQRLVEAGTITIIDGVLVTKDADGATAFVEFEELGAEDEAKALSDLLDRAEDLVSDEDVEALAAELEPNSSAAILVFEHTWAKPLHDAIADAGGVLAADLRIPGRVVDEVLAALAEQS